MAGPLRSVLEGTGTLTQRFGGTPHAVEPRGWFRGVAGSPAHAGVLRAVSG